MPYPNEHSARIKNPDLFLAGTTKRKEIAPGVTIIMGKLKADPKGKGGPMVTGSYRFDKSKFTADQARKWLKDHDVKPTEFEPAEKAKETFAYGYEAEPGKGRGVAFSLAKDALKALRAKDYAEAESLLARFVGEAAGDEES